MTDTITTITPKINFGQLRASGVRRVRVECPNCSNYSVLHGGRFSDAVRLNEIESHLVCHCCGRRGGEVTPAPLIVIAD